MQHLLSIKSVLYLFQKSSYYLDTQTGYLSLILESVFFSSFTYPDVIQSCRSHFLNNSWVFLLLLFPIPLSSDHLQFLPKLLKQPPFCSSSLFLKTPILAILSYIEFLTCSRVFWPLLIKQ